MTRFACSRVPPTDIATAGSTRVTWTQDVAPTRVGRAATPVLAVEWRARAALCLAGLETRDAT